MSDNQTAAPAAPETSSPAIEAPESSTSVAESPEAQAAAALAQATTPEEKKEVIKQLKKLQLKVGGKIQHIEFDPNDDEFMTRELQKSRAFDSTSAEKAQLEKDVRKFVEDLRKDPKKALSDPTIGVDLKKLAAAIIEEEISNSKKSPDVLAREKMEAELKAMKEEREKEKEDGKKKEFERLQAQEFERYDMLMTKALDTSDLPKSPYVVKKMADYMLMGLQQGYDITPDDVVGLVRDEIQEDIKEMFKVMPDDIIEKFIGKDKLNSMRKRNLAKAKSAPTTPKVVDTGKKKEEPKSSGKKQNFKDFFGV